MLSPPTLGSFFSFFFNSVKENKDPCPQSTYILSGGRRIMEAENKYCYAELQKMISATEEGQPEQNKGELEYQVKEECSWQFR